MVRYILKMGIELIPVFIAIIILRFYNVLGEYNDYTTKCN